MTWVDTSLVIIIVLFLILLIWSRIMGQKMLDTFKEIVEMLKSLKQPVEQ